MQRGTTKRSPIRVDVFDAFGKFDRQPTTEKSADDCLAAREGEIAPRQLRYRHLFEEAKQARADESANGCSSNDEPAMIVRQVIAAAVARLPVDCMAHRVGEGLEERVKSRVRMDCHVRSIVGGMDYTLSVSELQRSVAWMMRGRAR